ncbi:methyl-accepting chemotaxis protein [Roseofilum sp. BLCC_M91]|uniref:Methyl-accepting chemotaxis protein n=1 Tax=Roseofilum halophilum BLCC-M91 TaxID=3022259 RepID=A0ABT7BNA4_9CYAN|nr:methyl-accepting chemotaxis protein [Roseofilum halophilum]MDJ1180675.1 methyl-accepting chemotaxis protein [Roseofilum halophilum BLCC-M91]
MPNSINLRVRWLIILGYSFPIFLFLGSSVFLNNQVNSASQIIENLELFSSISNQGDNMGYALRNMQVHMRYFILNPNPQNRSRVLDEFRTLESQFQDYRQLVNQDDRFDASLVDEYLDFLEEQVDFYRSLVNLIEINNIDAAREQWGSSITNLRLNSDLESLQNFRSKEQEIYLEKKQEQDLALQKIPALIWMVTLISIVVSMILGYLIISFLLSRLNDEALVLATSATQIADAMEQQDQSSSEQAIAVNETTTTIEQLKTSAQQSATQAESAAASVRQVLALALGEWQQSTESAAANSQVSLKVTSNQISEQVQVLIQQLDQIYGITNLLADLAAQTNMLALNASVEAVHAGEQGRGFSVIAKEIRKLADDSRSSAQKNQSFNRRYSAIGQCNAKIDRIRHSCRRFD